MTEGLSYAIVNTAAGWVGLLGSAKGLLAVTLPQTSPEAARQELGDGVNGATCSTVAFADLTERLRRYFSGRRVDFADHLDLARATPFERKVWTAARLIPYGETRSYGWVAGQIGQPRAVRAVGQALGKNPLPIIIPCHRVVAANGQLRGFRGGLEMKRYLLSLEAFKPGAASIIGLAN
ncbi:MAG: methylated-DNA--[protein]-cysteine S-methyltransferase [Chloroflexota bacterium]|nr:methylated-DNA--[protein]-cysteine S-methyltransferase [Chloroflexota bacterium]